MKKISQSYRMDTLKYNELKKQFNSVEIDCFMLELQKIAKKTLKRVKNYKKVV